MPPQPTTEGGYVGITVEVEVDAGFEADYVVVHVLNPDGQETFTMGEGPAGVFAGTFTILPFNRASRLRSRAGGRVTTVAHRVACRPRCRPRPPPNDVQSTRFVGRNEEAGAGWRWRPPPSPEPPSSATSSGRKQRRRRCRKHRKPPTAHRHGNRHRQDELARCLLLVARRSSLALADRYARRSPPTDRRPPTADRRPEPFFSPPAKRSGAGGVRGGWFPATAWRREPTRVALPRRDHLRQRRGEIRGRASSTRGKVIEELRPPSRE